MKRTDRNINFSEEMDLKIETTTEEVYTCQLCSRVKKFGFCLCIYKKDLICKQCDMTIMEFDEFAYHMKTFHPKPTTYESHITSDSEKYEDTNVVLKNSTSLFSCDICARVYNQKSNLEYHIRAHFGEKDYVCQKCGKQFLTKNILKVHEARHELKSIKCSYCDRMFNNISNLKQHEITHGISKGYVCEVCGGKFSRVQNLKLHQWIHREKRYKCQICLRKFTQLSTLKQHEYTHTKVKKYVCFCGKVFSQCGSFTRHRVYHGSNPPLFACNNCEKNFKYKISLLRHIRQKHSANNKCDIITEWANG